MSDSKFVSFQALLSDILHIWSRVDCKHCRLRDVHREQVIYSRRFHCISYKLMKVLELYGQESDKTVLYLEYLSENKKNFIFFIEFLYFDHNYILTIFIYFIA